MLSLVTYMRRPWLVGLVFVKYFTFLPDKTFLRLRFFLEKGMMLRLKNPVLFEEKIQWLKLYDRQPEYVKMVDKYAVKDYVSKKIGSEYVIQTLGVWDSLDDVDLDSLPEKFVLKTTHGGGGYGVVVCKDKSNFDYAWARIRLERSLGTDIFPGFREWPYKDVPKRIIAEQMLEIFGKEDLTDYKFFCFNGIPRYIQVIQDRYNGETIDFFDTNWNHMPFCGLNPFCGNASEKISMPKNLDKMVEIARVLSKGIPFVRIDLYNIDGKIYFGEITFYPASGFGIITPREWSEKLGDMIKLPR